MKKIAILDFDGTIADMKAKRQRDRERDAAEREQEAIQTGEQTDRKASPTLARQVSWDSMAPTVL